MEKIGVVLFGALTIVLAVASGACFVQSIDLSGIGWSLKSTYVFIGGVVFLAISTLMLVLTILSARSRES